MFIIYYTRKSKDWFLIYVVRKKRKFGYVDMAYYVKDSFTT